MARKPAMTHRKVEEPDPAKTADSVSDDDSSNSSSSDSALDTENDTARRMEDKHHIDDDDDDDDDKKDDGDDLSDSAAQRQSKRKPSKSRIKRIVHKQSPGKSPGASSSAGNPLPLPPINSLMMGPQSAMMKQASMVPSMASPFLPLSPGQQTPPGAFKCEVCGKLFGSQLKLDIHKPVHGRDRKDSYDCPQCGHKCTSWRAYLYHVSKHTGNGGKKHTCEICGRQFFAAQRLRNHMQSHMVGKNFCCLKCGKLFESQKRLDTHSLIHDTHRKDPFKCVDCGKVYDDWRAFKQHMKTHGSDGVVYRCELCAAQFYTQYEKEKHMKIHTADQRQQCPHCTKSFWTETQLSKHVRNKHRKRSYDCVICGRECLRASGLKQHMKMHTGEQDYFCHVCGQSFDNGNQLSVHSALHVGERPFACDQCGKCFAKKSHYHRHLVVHAAGQQYSCGMCGRQFDHRLQLSAHMAAHTFDGQQTSACQACSQTFDSHVELEAHAHTHGNAPPYVCGLCGKLFAEQRYFRQHMKRHAARSRKLKLRTSSSLVSPGSATRRSSGESGTPVSPDVGEHPCHMCGLKFPHSRALVAHIEEHKRSGMMKYMDVLGAKGSDGKMHQQFMKRDTGSDDGSDTGSDSDVSDKHSVFQSKTTIHFGMQTQGLQSSMGPGSHSGHNSAMTHQSEQGMVGRMQASQAPHLTSTPVNTVSSAGMSSVAMTPHSREGGEPFHGQPDRFYSSPVFPSQSGSYATPYHAAAQQFHPHTPGDNYANGSSETGSSMDMNGQFSMPAKPLPNFADFSRQLALSTKPGYPEYAESGGRGASMGHSSVVGGYSYPEGVSPSRGYMAGGCKALGVKDEDGSMPVYPSMSVFPTIPSQSQGSGASSRGDNPPSVQFEPMFQFQPLGN